MRTIAIFFISLLIASFAKAQESKYFHIDSTSARMIVIDPLNKRNVIPKDVVLKGDYGYTPQNGLEWMRVTRDLCSRLFKDLPSGYEKFLNRVFVVVRFNKEGEIGNEFLFIPRDRFREIFAYEELLYQYVLELRKINMLPYVDLNPAYFSTAVRRIKLYE